MPSHDMGIKRRLEPILNRYYCSSFERSGNGAALPLCDVEQAEERGDVEAYAEASVPSLSGSDTHISG